MIYKYTKIKYMHKRKKKNQKKPNKQRKKNAKKIYIN